MGEFGWAYISGSTGLRNAEGVSGSVQFKDTSGGINGSDKFRYKNEHDVLELTGNLRILGDITASNYVIENVSNLEAAGSSKFGNSSDDLHQFTGSIYADGTRHLYTGSVHIKGATDVAGPMTASTTITATKFIGDGSELTNLPAATGISHANSGQYRLVSSVTSTSIQGESNLIWESSNLKITGSTWVSSILSGSDLRGDGQNIDNISATKLSHGTLDNARLPSAISVTSVAGDGSGLTALNASNISAGTINNTYLPTIDNSKLPSIINVSRVSGSMGLSGSTVFGKTAKFSQDVTVQGTLTANNLNITTTGDTIFGDNDADEHQFTGSVFFKGPLSASTGISASVLIGDGAQITGLPPYGSPAIGYFNDGAQYRLVTAVNADTVQGEANLTWKSNNLFITGSVYGSSNINSTNLSASSVIEAARITGSIGVSGSLVLGETATFSRNVTANAFYGDGSNLLNVGGTLTVKEEGSSLTTEATSINFIGAYVTASNSGTDVTVTVNAGAGGASVIGPAEDASYADGLFSDFTTTTTVGTAVDKFNEVLKILAPTPAPGVQHIGVEGSVPTGITAKLSYGSSNAIGGVTSHGTTVFSPAIGRNGVYTTDTDGYKRKLGIFDGQDITGIINYDIAASVTNGNYAYKNDSFGNGETGTLKLELNGNPIHTINLASVAGAGAPPNGTDDSNVNGNGSGFIDVSATANTLDGNGADWGSIFKYRSAKYKIAASDQVSGWNYLRVIHTVGSTDYASNYVEWINDPGSIASHPLTLDRNRVEDVSLIGSRYLSGVKYNTDATANYKVDILNMYKNVFPNGGTPISFTPTNAAAISAVAVNDLAGVETNTKIIQLTKSLDCNVNNLLDGQLGCNISVTHPLKNNLSNQGAASAGGFLIENRTQTHDWNTENFHDESFRITSASYDDQNSVRVAASTWNSQTHMLSAGGYDDGLLLYNQALRSPKQGVNSGDFRNSGDGGSLTNGPAGNPNYSGISGDRTYFRVLTNSSGVTARDLRIQTTKTSTTFNNSALTTNNAHLFVKIPGTTGWMDATKDFYYGNILDFDGALNPSASNDVDSGNNTHYLTFGTASVANGDHIVLKIVAKDTWTGNISTMEFTPNVSTATDAAALTTIDSNTDGLLNAKLSFGASNDIATYSKATGSAIGGSNFNINDNYTRAGTRSGVFSSKPTFIGDVNSGNQFKFAYEGSLILKVNDTEIHSVDLHNLAAIPAAGGQYDTNVNGSGFDLSRVDFRSGPASALDYRYPYRTGTFKVVPADQNLGWNWAQVIHRRDGETDITTSYVEWVNDTDGSTMDSGSAGLENFEHDHIYYQSGVKYFASRPSASFAFTVSNAYKNVYYHDSDGINFPTVTRCSINKIRIAGDGINVTESADGVNQLALGSLKAVANSHAEIFQVTGTVLYANNESIVGDSNIFTSYDDLAVKGQVKHPIKADLETKTYGTTAFMFHSGTLNSSTLYTNEYFGFERYRLQDTTYANQAAITNSSNKWNSQTSVNDQAGNATHATGLVTVNGKCVSPFKIGNSGDTRNVADKGASGLQAPSGNPNYSTLTNATRTYYRYFENNSGVLKQNGLTITLQGDAKLVSKDSGDGRYEALGANKNITVELKVPTDPSYTGGSDLSTGWMDCVKAWDDTEDGTVDGAGLAHGSVTQTFTGNGSSTINLEFQTLGIYNGQKFVVRIRAHKDWTGYLSSVRMAY